MLMHITDRLLICETELMIIQFRNNINKKNCEMFIKNEMMIIMIIYHKKIEANKKIKIIHYYLLCKMRKLMLYHM